MYLARLCGQELILIQVFLLLLASMILYSSTFQRRKQGQLKKTSADIFFQKIFLELCNALSPQMEKNPSLLPQALQKTATFESGLVELFLYSPKTKKNRNLWIGPLTRLLSCLRKQTAGGTMKKKICRMNLSIDLILSQILSERIFQAWQN